jgi:hypothetical protein
MKNSQRVPQPQKPEEERPLPQNVEAERSILGAILLDNNAINPAIEKLKPEDFFHNHHRRIYQQMIALGESQQAIDLVTLTEQLQRSGELESVGGAAYVSQLMDGVPHITNVEHYARIVKEKALLRGLIHAARTIQQQALEAEDDADAILDRAEDLLGPLKGVSTGWKGRFHTIEELPDGEPQTPICGILPEGVTFIGGSSGVGKTWFALAMARALIQKGKFLGVWDVKESMNVLYLCPEMNARTFGRRAKRFGIGGERFRCMTISDGAALELTDRVLRAAIQELKPVVFLDTAIRFSSAEDENSATHNARGLAREVFALIYAGSPAVVCLHHRAKDAAKAEELTLENTLRGSGDLGAIADAVYGLQYDRGDGSATYLKESKRLVRLRVRCVKSRDFRSPEDFRIQLEPYLDEIGDLAYITDDEPNGPAETEVEKLSRAIAENPTATKIVLQGLTGIGRNRIERLAAQGGWSYVAMQGWSRQ